MTERHAFLTKSPARSSANVRLEAVRAVLLLQGVLAACGFSGAAAPPVDATMIDVGIDVSTDTATARVRDGLVGLWTFDEAMGATVASDTSGSGSPVALRVVTSAPAGLVAPTFTDGIVTADTHSRMISMPEKSRLTSDIVAGGGVTLEIWLRARAATQGDAAAPRFVVGLAKNITNRNVALLQRGDRWVGVVRTSAMPNGGPELVSNSTVSTTDFTQVVIVADATQRRIFVNDRVELEDPVSGPLATWDPDVLLTLFEEPTGGRHWTGSVSLVALYNRALTPDEVHANFVQGAHAR